MLFANYLRTRSIPCRDMLRFGLVAIGEKDFSCSLNRVILITFHKPNWFYEERRNKIDIFPVTRRRKKTVKPLSVRPRYVWMIHMFVKLLKQIPQKLTGYFY